MNEEKKTDKKEILAIIIMGGLFVLIQGLSLLLISPFVNAGLQPTFEDENNLFNIIYIVVIMLVFTALILLIAKFWKKNIIQVVILGAIGYTAVYAFFLPLFSISLPNITPIISISLAVLSGFILVFVLLKYPEWYIIDISGCIVGIAAIVVFGISLGVFLVIILLIALAIYDAISVYKTKHMIDLADTVMDLRLPVLLVVPKIRHYSLLKETKGLKEKLKDDEERDAFFMGLGDIIMPGILAASIYFNVSDGLLISLSVIAGTLIGFAVLMTFVIKGKPQAGLPLLCSGAIAGYLISSYLLFGKLVGLTLPSF